MFKKILKWTGIVLLVLIVALLGVYGYIHRNISARMEKRYTFTAGEIPIAYDSSALQRGAHLVAIKGCTDCHGKDLAGRIMAEDFAIGRLAAPNLTTGKGGLPKNYSENNWIMALRHGIAPDGRPLLLMPSHESTLLSQEDLTALIAYCRSLPPVDKELPRNKVGPVARIMTYAGKMPLLSVEMIDHQRGINAMPAKHDAFATGKYLAVSCQGCHRPDMRGGEPLAPGFPPVPDITTSGPSGQWTIDQFRQMLSTGKRPDGRQVSNDNMPWQMTAQYTPEEVEAIYTYLHKLN
ncbi:MAG: cytochrome c [Mucilaginibacter polytrichastri]|nr:cytochrome c [Mucilaginibacter polytrichastri]